MKRFLLFSLSLLFLISCGKDDDNPAAPQVQKEIVYKGTAKTVIDYYDFNPTTSQDYFVEQKTYNYNVDVFRQPPLKFGSIVETNPFNLSIYPSQRGDGIEEEGHIDVASAVLIVLSELQQVLLQYWDFTLNNGTIDGQLNNLHKDEAAAANLIWAYEELPYGPVLSMPFVIAQNATMKGTMDNNKLQLIITGQSYDTYKKFVTEINAQVK